MILKALSVKQPWAWLIVNRYKPLENRTWWTSHRGPTAIHAGLGFDQDGYDWVREHHPHIPLPKPHEFERGGIVGLAELTRCVTIGNSLDKEEAPWFMPAPPGKVAHGFIFRNASPLPFQPMRGKLGFFPAEVSHAG